MFATRLQALVAELVDALVSNTNGVTPVPVRLRPKVQSLIIRSGFFYILPFLCCYG
mgnify:CR=1 FL=1